MKRYKHNLSHYHLTTGGIGLLMPIQWTEVLPGDSFRFSTSALIRCTPLLAPVMHPVSVRIHHFFVPNRVMDPAEGQNGGWEGFITAGGDAQVSPRLPRNAVAGPLDDYLGIPPAYTAEVCGYPYHAYAAIYNEYYRDQDLQTEVSGTDVTVRAINFEKDYLTSARPNPQKNPFISRAYVTEDAVDGDYVSTLDIRKALASQRFQEARSRFGSRYTEYLQYLGIKPSDARLQRPEYLGGGSKTINFSEVLQTVDSEVDGPLGKLGGHGIAGLKTPTAQRFFEEHGIFMTLMSVRPKALYMDGLKREWLRRSAQDYWQKEMELEGQEQVYNYEVYAADESADSQAFGFQDRYYSYRRGVSYVSRDFRDIYDYWHLGRKFASRPALNSTFIAVQPDSNKRIFADQINDPLLIACNHHIKARRLVRRNVTPRVV